MKTLVFVLLILTTLQQDSVLSFSGDSSVEVSSNQQGDSSQAPPESTLTTDTTLKSKLIVNQNFLNENSLGGNSKWVFPTSGRQTYPIFWQTTYTINFTTDCPQKDVILTLASTGFFIVYLNGVLVQNWSSPWPFKLVIPLKANCGCNTIKVIVCNCHYTSPAALIYTLTQNTTGCYNCTNEGVTFYNRNTCKCECASSCTSCGNYLQQYLDYPTCGCQCSNWQLSKTCTKLQFWDARACRCSCKPRCCPKGTTFDPKTCQCKEGCVQDFMCAPGYYWSNFTCRCEPKCPPKVCDRQHFWDPLTCQCKCYNEVPCGPAQIWNSVTCSCQCSGIWCPPNSLSLPKIAVESPDNLQSIVQVKP